VYFHAGMVATWLGVVGWAAAAASLVAAGVLLRKRAGSFAEVLTVTVLITAVRLLSFPLHYEYALGGSALALGFAVIVFGPEVAAVSLFAATLAFGAIAGGADAAALGGNLLVHASWAPWLLWWLYRRLRAAAPSRAAAYVAAFVVGAAGAPVVIFASLAALYASGFSVTPATPLRATAAALALTAAEGALAAWGYTLALSRKYSGDGRVESWRPATAQARVGLLLCSLIITVAVAPATPLVAGVFTAAPKLPPGTAAFVLRAAAGTLAVLVAAVAASFYYALTRLLRRRAKANAAG